MRGICVLLALGGCVFVSNATVIYDNGMSYGGMIASQYDPEGTIDPELADDFVLTGSNLCITDVHWIGGYYNPIGDANFDWTLRFYEDRGDGAAPGDLIATYAFANADTNETFIEQAHNAWFGSYSVVLPAPLCLNADTQYWMSAQSVGVYPPQSGFAWHMDPILGHEAVIKSDYYGMPDWTSTWMFGTLDMCFQLVGSSPGDLDCDGDVDFDDIDPFVLALSGQAAYEATYPDCDYFNADCNGDGYVDFDDIDPFVAILSGG